MNENTDEVLDMFTSDEEKEIDIEETNQQTNEVTNEVPKYEHNIEFIVPETPKDNKRKKEKKPAGFAVRLLRTAVCAVLIGALAGAALYGTVYAGYKIFPAKDVNVQSLSDADVDNIARQLYEKQMIEVSQLNSTSFEKGQIQATVLDVSDIVENVITSVVAISGTTTVTNQFGFGFWGDYSQSYEAPCSGSGIIMGKNDDELLVVTNAHVVDNVNNLKVLFFDNTAVDAVIKGIKQDSDLAVVAIKLADINTDTLKKITIAKLGSSDEIKVGEAAIAIGNAAGYGISVTTGIVSATGRSLTVENVVYSDLIQTDAAINPGNSGGALFNSHGEVIGINSVKMSDTSVEGMGYAISIESVKDIIDDLSTQVTRDKLSDDERGYLGVQGTTVTSSISSAYGWPEGVLVKRIVEGSAADLAGLEVNDVIKTFDGKTIDSWETLVDIMGYYKAGEEVEIVYYHLQKGAFVETSTTVTLSERPEEN